MIKITNVNKIYKSKDGDIVALDNINLHIDQGDIYGIIGPSGAGKSTLIRVINLLEKPTSGNILIDGIDLMKLTKNDLREERKEVGMIFQTFNLMNNSTVSQNITFPMEISHIEKHLIKDRLEELLEMVGLKDKENVYPAKLSGGQKQRVGIARALANKPKILLCDEPTSALDPVTTKSILELLKDINQKLNITIVLITHQMEVIKAICNKTAVIENGLIVEEGLTKDILSNPSSETLKSFLS